MGNRSPRWSMSRRAGCEACRTRSSGRPAPGRRRAKPAPASGPRRFPAGRASPRREARARLPGGSAVPAARRRSRPIQRALCTRGGRARSPHPWRRAEGVRVPAPGRRLAAWTAGAAPARWHLRQRREGRPPLALGRNVPEYRAIPSRAAPAARGRTPRNVPRGEGTAAPLARARPMPARRSP